MKLNVKIKINTLIKYFDVTKVKKETAAFICSFYLGSGPYKTGKYLSYLNKYLNFIFTSHKKNKRASSPIST
jgi:hypothetical protein